MKCQSEIEIIADNKWNDADFLFQNGRYDAAYYLGGYTIELLLKAKICKTLGIDNFFDETSLMKKLKFPQTFRIHDFKQLLILSGLHPQFGVDIATSESLQNAWSIVCEWDEESRYLTGRTKEEVEKLLISLKEIAVWIQEHL